MSYSPYDFHPKLFVLNGTVKTTGTSANLAAGEFGLYDPFTNAVVTVGNAATHPKAYIAQGSYYNSDTLGKVHGGYKESIKSPAFTRGIDPKYVKKFYKTGFHPAQNQVVRLFWDGTTTGTGPQFLCGKTYYMRLEAQGEPVLRFINRYIYKQFGAFTGCCANDCTAPCTDEVVDAAAVLLDYATQINADPLFSNFVVASVFTKTAATTISTTSGSAAATVASGTGIVVGQKVISANVPAGTTVSAVVGTAVTLSANATATAAGTAVTFSTPVVAGYTSPALAADKAAVVAGLEIAVIYSSTIFGDCSFNQADYYNNEFVDVIASMVYQNGDVCESGEVQMNSFTNTNFTEVTPFITPQGSGEMILRDFIASQHQSGIYFSDMPRDRETTNNVALTAVSRAANYNRYYLVYSNPITGNPSNALSHDQYILSFAFKSTDSAATWETLMLAWLQAHNPAVTLQTTGL